MKQLTVCTTHYLTSAPVDPQLRFEGQSSEAPEVPDPAAVALTVGTSPSLPALPSSANFQNHEMQTKTGPPLRQGHLLTPQEETRWTPA